MTTIKSVTTALPGLAYSRDDILQVSSRWLSDSPHERELFERFIRSSQVSHRHFAVPLEKILELGGPQERAELFQHTGRELLRSAIDNLLTQSDTDPSSIEHLVVSSCSAPVIPSIDVHIIDDLTFQRSVCRVPLYQVGCAGGIIGLAMAHRLRKPGEQAVVAAIELCSLVYQPSDLSGGNLVGSAIFGDGAAAVLLGDSKQGLRVIDAQSHLIPDSVGLMGYTIEDDGAHLRLDRALPQTLARVAPPFVTTFLEGHNLTPQDVSWWLFHPGGVKILSALEEALSIDRLRSRWAWEVLEQYGNMSSASILFVLDSFLRSNVAQVGDKVCMLGVGPGLTIEALLCEQA